MKADFIAAVGIFGLLMIVIVWLAMLQSYMMGSVQLKNIDEIGVFYRATSLGLLGSFVAGVVMAVLSRMIIRWSRK